MSLISPLPDRPPDGSPVEPGCSDVESAAALARRLGVVFNTPSILVDALTHRSFLNELEVEDPRVVDNERLEFLGDAVLDYVVGDWAYRRFPASHEGELTRLRSALVREATLAAFAREIELGPALRLGKGEREAGRLMTGGEVRSSVLADAFEAVVGALYLDQGIEVTARWLTPFLERWHDANAEVAIEHDAKTRLQELSQERFKLTPRYDTLEATGPDHAKHFVIAVRLGDQVVGTGEGRSKAVAAQAAATQALGALEARGLIPTG